MHALTIDLEFSRSGS